MEYLLYLMSIRVVKTNSRICCNGKIFSRVTKDDVVGRLNIIYFEWLVPIICPVDVNTVFPRRAK